jgi:hypothetical protein
MDRFLPSVVKLWESDVCRSLSPVTRMLVSPIEIADSQN